MRRIIDNAHSRSRTPRDPFSLGRYRASIRDTVVCERKREDLVDASRGYLADDYRTISADRDGGFVDRVEERLNVSLLRVPPCARTERTDSDDSTDTAHHRR